MNLYKEIVKEAGTKVTANPKQWPAEVLKAIKNQHPYIDVSSVDVKFDNVSPEEGRASGLVIIQKTVVLPFTIRKNDKTGKHELDPLDVMFYDRMFRALNKESLERALTTPIKSVKKIPNTNQYIGNLTGDTSPMEWSAGTGMSSRAGFGLLGQVVRNPNDLSALFNYLSSYNGINARAQVLGLNDSLENLKNYIVENTDNTAAVRVHREGVNLVLSFPNGTTRNMPLTEAKVFLGANFESVYGQINRKGYCIISDIPETNTVSWAWDGWDTPENTLMTEAAPISDGGKYMLRVDAGYANAWVATRVVQFDGQNRFLQCAITEGNEIGYGKSIVGTPIEYMASPAGSSTLSSGSIGVFWDDTYNVCTPRVKVHNIVIMPDQPVVINAVELESGDDITLIMLPDILRPMRVPGHHRMHLPIEVTNSTYYVPTMYIWVECPKTIKLVNRYEAPTPTYVSKVANRYSFSGGGISIRDISTEDMQLKLANMGASSGFIEELTNLENRETRKIFGMKEPEEVVEKVAGRDFAEFKKYAKEILEGMDNIQNKEDNPNVLDVALSLQFISEETLGELVAAKPIIEEVEDKIAKLLMASRQGEETINEASAQRALKGLGGVMNSLTNLAIDLEERSR